MLEITPDIRISLEEFEFTFARSGGPGGQNVNKVSSKATLRWPVRASLALRGAVRERFLTKYANRITTTGDLLVTSQRFRDAPRNADDCLEKLRAMLMAVVTAPRPRRPTRPTRGSVQRRLGAKRRRSETKQRRTASDD